MYIIFLKNQSVEYKHDAVNLILIKLSQFISNFETTKITETEKNTAIIPESWLAK